MIRRFRLALKRFPAAKRGVAAVEFALILPFIAWLQETVALPVLSMVMHVTVTTALFEENGVRTEVDAARMPGIVWLALMVEYCETISATVLALSDTCRLADIPSITSKPPR